MTVQTYHSHERLDIDTPSRASRNPANPGLSIIIPAYNEEQRLPSTLTAVNGFVTRRDLDCEVLIVDNASSDGTSAVVEDAARTSPWLRLLRIEQRGKGAAVRSGVLAARGAIVLFADADLSWSVEDLIRFPAFIDSEVAVVIGSREEQGASRVGAPPYRVLMSRVFNLIVQACAVGGINDTQCGFKVFRADAARAIFDYQRIDGFGFDVEVLYLARRLGYTIVEAPLAWEHREGSRVSPVSTSIKMLTDVLTVRANAVRGRYPRLAGNPGAAMPLVYTKLPTAGQ